VKQSWQSVLVNVAFMWCCVYATKCDNSMLGAVLLSVFGIEAVLYTYFGPTCYIGSVS